MDIDASYAEQLLADHASDTLIHNQQVGQLMRYFAAQVWEDESKRYITWLLHDIDRDHIGKKADQHLWDQFVQIIDQLPYSDSLRADLVQDIRTHYPAGTGHQPQTLIQQYLISIDELSGLMYAYARMRGGFDGMEVKWVMKKIKDKSFAAGVDREHVRNCESYLNLSLEEFVEQMISAFQSFSYNT